MTDRRESTTTETTSVIRHEIDDSDASLAGAEELINQYAIFDVLGQGAFGTVKRCKDRDGNEFAMKCLSKKRMKKKRVLGKKGSALDDVMREIAILKKLEHPCVVNLVEVIDDPKIDTLYMIFELMSDGTVLELSPTERVEGLSLDTARNMFRDLVAGIDYCHRHNVVHRDIKPENLLRARGNQGLKIADFGVSMMFEGDDNTSKSAGSPAFLAPEAIDADVDSFKATMLDVWAMGITLYSFIFGELPFYDDNRMVLYEKIRNDNVQFPSSVDVGDDLKNLIESLLQKDPSKRIGMDELRMHPWVTDNNTRALEQTPDETTLVQVTDEDIMNAITQKITLMTMIKIKQMGMRRTFGRSRKQNNNTSTPSQPASRSGSRQSSSSSSVGSQMSL